MRKTLVSILALILLLVACAPSPDPTEVTVDGALDAPRTRTPPSPILTKTASPTQTKTSIPNPTATASPTSTVAPTKTSTPVPNVTITPVPGLCPEHLNEWHAPADVACMRHHHGIDPRSPEVKEIFNVDGFDIERDMLDPFGELWQPLWLSSPSEERHGFIWALYSNRDCIQGGSNSQFDFTEYGCITDVLVRHHDTGTLDHLIKMFHSEALIVKACEKLPDGTANMNKCGILRVPGRNPHYGSMHAAYKKVQCNLPGQPTNEAGNPPPLLQANYRTSRTQLSAGEFNVQYWVSVTTDGILDQYYVNTFNSTITNFAWSADGWQFWPAVPNDPKVPDVSFCGVDKDFTEIQARLMQQPAIEGVEHRIFQIIDLRIVLPLSADSTQTIIWMDLYGNLLPPETCHEPSGFCVPWLRTPNFPIKSALNFDAINLGRCNLVPCFIADDNGVELLPPWEDVP